MGSAHLQFLLILSAMLAGLTGFVSGDRTIEPRQVEQALAAAVAEVAPVREVAVRVTARIPTGPSREAKLLPSAPAPVGALPPVDERRLI